MVTARSLVQPKLGAMGGASWGRGGPGGAGAIRWRPHTRCGSAATRAGKETSLGNFGKW